MTIAHEPTSPDQRSLAGSSGPDIDLATARWLPIQRGAAAAIVLCGLFVQVVMAREVIPPLVVIMVVFLVAGVATLRRPRGASIAVGVLGLLALLLFLPDIVRDMGDPESAFTFVITGAITVAALLAVLGGVMVMRRREGAGVAARAPIVATLAVVALLAIGVGARLTMDSADAQPGDLMVVAERIEFVPTVLEAEAGTIAVHVDNRDLAPHDFTIDELDVSLHVPERAARRVDFEAGPGTYTAICTLPGHERMEVTLNVR
jgi:plastocyanin